MRLWLDDVRPAPEGYKWVKSVNEAKIHCCQFLNPNRELTIEEFNLDHDAGDYAFMGDDYIKFLEWLEEKQYFEGWKINSIFVIHSANPVGRMNMEAIIRHNGWRYHNG